MALDRRQLLRFMGGAGFGLPWLLRCGRELPSAVHSPDDPGSPAHAGACDRPWWLCGDFAPTVERQITEFEVVGQLPDHLSGLYVRNGPNPLERETDHWFVGDGMVHGLRVEAGQALWFRSRYVATDVLGKSRPLGPPGLTEHQANTSLVGHAGRLLCLFEAGLPYAIDPDDLATIGPFDFDGALDGPMTAHPKRDPLNGDLHMFGYEVFRSSLTYRVVDQRGRVTKKETVSLRAPVMMHDFQITESRVLFLDYPLVFSLALAIAGVRMPFAWRPELGARVGVMPRAGGAEDLRWIEAPLGFVFHTISAHDDPDDANAVILWAIWYPEGWIRSEDISPTGRVVRIRIDLAAGKVEQVELDPHPVELPTVDPRSVGRPHRHAYGLCLPERATWKGICKWDLHDHDVAIREFPQHELGEMLFVPAADKGDEDEGCLLGYAYNRTTELSELMVLDATTLADVARVHLPVRVPHGFHGYWLDVSRIDRSTTSSARA